MKKTKLIAAIFCTISLTTAGGAILVSSLDKEQIEASASTTTTIYFTPDSNWADASAGFRVGTTSNFNSAHQMSLVSNDFKAKIANYSGNTIYSYTFTGSVGNVYFFRTSSDGGTKWNYSNEVVRPSDQYYFIKTANWWDTWTQDQGSWNNTDTIYTTEEQTASSQTGRVFFHNSGTSWASDGAPSVRAWGGDAGMRDSKTTSASIYNLNWVQDDTGTYYGYADIPTNVSGFQFVLMSGTGTYKSIWNYQKNDAFTPNSESFSCVFYCGEYSKENMIITIGGAKDDKAGATLLTKVYEAHYSCSGNIYNGYPTVSNLDNHFYSHALEGATATTIDTSYTISNKHATMTRMNNTTNQSALRLIKTNSVMDAGYLLTIIPILLVTTIGLSMFLKKKKINK